MTTRPRLPISTIVLTLNEEANIADCLASVAEWTGEIFVVDSGSTDDTLARIEPFGATVVHHPWEHYAAQRNWAQDTLPLQYEWVLHLDADERVAPDLVAALYDFFAGEATRHTAGAMIKRRTFFMGRWIRYGGHYPSWHTRLFRKEVGRCEEQLYDQHFVVNGAITRLDGNLDNILPSNLDVWLNRHLAWAEKEAENSRHPATSTALQVHATPLGNPIQQRRWFKRTLFGRAPLFWRAFGYFFLRYFLLFGFLDGKEGLIFHFLQGCWFRFYVDAKIYEQQKVRSKG
jgi:glycosyltransferase involved in cell wall biosynthesis